MCKIYGMARVSTKQQNIQRQVRNIEKAYPDAIMIEEYYTGTKLAGRVELERVIKTAKPGDTLVFDSVSRMSRNAEEGFNLYQELYSRGVELVFLKEPHINTAVYREAAKRQIQTISTGDAAADELLNGITEALNRYTMRLAAQQIQIAFDQAEKEVKDLHQRVSEGMETARLNGSQIGQVAGRKLNVKKAQPMKEQILKYSKDFDGTLNDAECMKLTGLARNTYYKYKKELKDERDKAAE